MPLVIGLVGAGEMGSAVGARLREGGALVTTTLAGRSLRTRGLAEAARLELRPTLDEVVAQAGIVLTIVPPAAAREVATALAGAAARTGARPLVADLNAVAPATVQALGAELSAAGLELVDGSISGPPPDAGREPTRVYLSGPRAAEVAALPASGIAWRVVGAEIGTASAVKMSTASFYKGRVALIAQALRAAHANGVLEHVLDDLEEAFPGIERQAGRTLSRAAGKSRRYVGEMHEIAASQQAAGLTPALFAALAEVWEEIGRSPLADGAPEEVPAEVDLRAVLDALGP